MAQKVILQLLTVRVPRHSQLAARLAFVRRKLRNAHLFCLIQQQIAIMRPKDSLRNLDSFGLSLKHVLIEGTKKFSAKNEIIRLRRNPCVGFRGTSAGSTSESERYDPAVSIFL